MPVGLDVSYTVTGCALTVRFFPDVQERPREAVWNNGCSINCVDSRFSWTAEILRALASLTWVAGCLAAAAGKLVPSVCDGNLDAQNPIPWDGNTTTHPLFSRECWHSRRKFRVSAFENGWRSNAANKFWNKTVPTWSKLGNVDMGLLTSREATRETRANAVLQPFYFYDKICGLPGSLLKIWEQCTLVTKIEWQVGTHNNAEWPGVKLSMAAFLFQFINVVRFLQRFAFATATKIHGLATTKLFMKT